MGGNNLDLKQIEEKYRKYWEKEKIYKFNPASKKKIYSIDTDPPTVSGKMHLGHAFHYAQQDFLIRYKRMKGFSVFYPFGTDDNGLATIRLIEKEKGVKAFDLGREKFIKLVLETLEKELRPQYMEDWKRLGMSCDWDISYTTIDNTVKEFPKEVLCIFTNKEENIGKELLFSGVLNVKQQLHK